MSYVLPSVGLADTDCEKDSAMNVLLFVTTWDNDGVYDISSSDTHAFETGEAL